MKEYNFDTSDEEEDKRQRRRIERSRQRESSSSSSRSHRDPRALIGAPRNYKDEIKEEDEERRILDDRDF
eukprot:5587781-Karenia_brevis.AAC.1